MIHFSKEPCVTSAEGTSASRIWAEICEYSTAVHEIERQARSFSAHNRRPIPAAGSIAFSVSSGLLGSNGQSTLAISSATFLGV